MQYFKKILFWALLSLFSSLSSATELLLAKVYPETSSDHIEISEWLVSEKLDGVRAFWNGEKLYFRSGREINAPAWFTQDFPQQKLDGELWMRRGTFSKLSGIVRREEGVDHSESWKKIKYKIFELPDEVGTFMQRAEKMVALTEHLEIPWLTPIKQHQLKSEEELFIWLDQVVAADGEGVMLHRANSLYHAGRSSDLLKLKKWQDAEATVIKILPGNGKYSEMMGALLVENGVGRRFKIGSGFSDRERQTPPSVGTLITYKYTGVTSSGLPRFASFMRIRKPF
ncbi:MAG: DNA ligase [Thiotrichales bacterium]|jgi:DNA ligase-1|nr:DNA ligase [Thiotrichales bacterium]MBT3612823.1 DNA ligase [Thiotrichales bacterium]MBT3751875.1 DNA ligase [Thiotrichales bacterium]MBT3837249.1 DNA ligase [Thiotrichales bacterium]MBT4152269.1 DNA ligase [Thiotrichales bacterium]